MRVLTGGFYFTEKMMPRGSSGFLEWGPVGVAIVQMGDTYQAHFNYQRRPKYWPNFQLVLNAAYNCPLSIDCMHIALVIKTKSNSI